MSRFYEQKYKGWSDSNLHKPFLYCIQTSEEEEPLYPSRLSLPIFSITHQCTPFKKTLSNYCLCGRQYDGRMRPLRIQIEEALAEDKQTALIQHLNLSTSALEALVQYGQSLQVSQLAACRVLNISHLLAFPQSYSINFESDTTHLSMHLQQLEEQKKNKLIVLQDLMEHCSKHVTLSRHFNELMNNHCNRKKDFHTATKNFKNFLNNFTLSVSQMQKLHQQYDTILNSYQQSRCMLDLELPKVISTRLMALYEGFEKIKTVCNNTTDDNEILALFKLIGERLYTKSSNT
ncbi:unnamed protein product, partial [Heterotrigona itama]